MRKLKLQVQMSVDGFVARAGGELDWLVWDWDDELKKYTAALTESVDTILLGRKMADGFISHWKAVAVNPDDPEHAYGVRFTDTPKVVFTHTLDESPWHNTVLAKGDIADEVNRLKNQEGNDLVVYGGAGFVSSLIERDLIDEYHLFVNPVALGEGMTIFSKLPKAMTLTPVRTTQYECGIAVHEYFPGAVAEASGQTA